MMNLNITKKLSSCLVVAAALGLSTAASAQTILWGAGHSNTMIDSIGRFATTDGTLAGAGWTSMSMTGTITTDWFWSPNGESVGPNAISQINGGTGAWITSPSIADGCGFFDSDSIYTATNVFPQIATMTSPIIDLTGYTDSLLAARFYVSYMDFDGTEYSVGFSTDGGASWTDVDYTTSTGGMGAQANYNGWVTIPFVGALDGVTDLTNCQLRFTFNADGYFCAIDDVYLTLGPEYDLTFAASSEDFDNRTIGYPMPYKRMMSSQVDGQTIIYGALLANNGGKTLPASANAVLEYNIEMDMGGTWTNVYSNSWAVGADIPAGDTLGLSGDLSTVLNTVLNTEGYYRAIYNVRHDLADADLSNDTMMVDFWITGDVVSTAPPSSTVDGPDANGLAFPGAGAGNVIQEFEWGNLYYFPAGLGWGLDSVSYRMFASSTFNTAVSEVETTVNVYQWVDGNADGQVSFEDELQIVTLSRDTIPVGAADYGTHVTSSVKIADPNTLNPNTNQFDLPLPLNDGVLYCVTVGQTNSDGIVDANDNRNGFFASTYEAAYEWNQVFAVEAFTPMRVVEGPAGGAGTESWFSGFSGAAQNPAIELRLLDLTINVEDVEATNADINIFPNPAAEYVTITADFDQVENNITYIVTDATGRVVYMENRAGIQNDVLNLDVANYTQGVYFVTIQTENGTSTQRFVKQ